MVGVVIVVVVVVVAAETTTNCVLLADTTGEGSQQRKSSCLFASGDKQSARHLLLGAVRPSSQPASTAATRPALSAGQLLDSISSSPSNSIPGEAKRDELELFASKLGVSLAGHR